MFQSCLFSCGTQSCDNRWGKQMALFITTNKFTLDDDDDNDDDDDDGNYYYDDNDGVHMMKYSVCDRCLCVCIQMCVYVYSFEPTSEYGSLNGINHTGHKGQTQVFDWVNSDFTCKNRYVTPFLSTYRFSPSHNFYLAPCKCPLALFCKLEDPKPQTGWAHCRLTVAP